MRLSTMNELPTARTMIDVFGGYNHNLRCGEGEFYEMKNLSSDDYPVLSPRRKRGTYETPEHPRGLLERDQLCYVDGSNIVIGEDRVDMSLTDDYKTLISMGAYIIILPDKKYINTTNHEDRGEIDVSVKSGNNVSFALCTPDGGEYKNIKYQSTEPENPTNLHYWLDTSKTEPVLKQYSSALDTWVEITETFIKIFSADSGIDKHFEVGDGVTISGVILPIVEYLNKKPMTIKAKGDNYIVVAGMLSALTDQNEPITIERKMPTMDFIVESKNRLWGCRYGKALNGEIVNEIYASKLGDFKNWNSFDGISTDSYAATVGTDGEFTGAVTLGGYPIFFKENHMHKVYGDFPSQYRIQDTSCRGVQVGCSKSLAIVNEVLYYKSRNAVCAYDGSLPQEVSFALGSVPYKNAVAGALGNKYYISMEDNDSMWHLFVFDTLKGLWHREDDTQASVFSAYKGDLYFIDYKDNQIKTVRGTVGIHEHEEVRWSATTGIIGTDSPDKKYISRLDIRMWMKVGTRVMFYVEYDSSGEWEHMFTMSGWNMRSFTVPVRPKRCDHMRLRIEGDGEAKIFSICKTIEQGSEL